MALTSPKPLNGEWTSLPPWVSEVHDTLNGVTDPAGWRLSLTGTSVPSGTDTRLDWTNAVSLVGVTDVNAPTHNRIRFNQAGRWQIRFTCRLPPGGTVATEALAQVRRFNSGGAIQEILPAGSVSGNPSGAANMSASGSMVVAATDYVEAWVYQASTAAKVPEAGPVVGFGWTMFEGYWVGAS